MKKIAIIFISILFGLSTLGISGCGYKEVQMQYLKTQQELIKAKYGFGSYKGTNPDDNKLVSVELDEEGRVKAFSMANPYQDNSVKIKGPAPHPAYGFVGSLFNSPFASILAGGYAGKMLLQEAGTHLTNSNNSVGGDGAFATEGPASIDNGIANSYNQPDNSDNSINNSNNNSSQHENTEGSYNDRSDNSIANSHNPVDESQKWENSENDSNFNNPDNRQNYENPDNRTNYKNPDNRTNNNNSNSGE